MSSAAARSPFRDPRLADVRDHQVASIDPDWQQKKTLWRGMRDMSMDSDAFKAQGGTEKAAMSTTVEEAIARDYANASSSNNGLLMEFETFGLNRGVEIHMFSLYPHEKEFLYPPLTNMRFDEHRQQTVECVDGKIVTKVPIIPTMA